MKAILTAIVCVIFTLSSLSSIAGGDENKSTSTYSLWLGDFRINNYYLSNELTFEIRIINNGNSDIEYAGGRFIINFYAPVANGGELTYSITGPDTSDLPVNLRPVNPQIHINGDSGQLILESNFFPGSGNGFLIPPDITGKRIIKMKLRTSASSFLIKNGAIGYYVEMYPEWKNLPMENSTNIFAYEDSRLRNITSPQNHFINGIGLTPVELTSFTSDVNFNEVTLRWSTAQEINNQRFYIERISPGSSKWIIAGSVPGHGTISGVRDYSFCEHLSSGTYNYRLKQIDYNGNYEFFFLKNEVDVGIPAKYKLLQNYPNPFNSSTIINYELKEDCNLNISLFDINGKEIMNLEQGSFKAGYYTLRLNSAELSTGIYFYRLAGHGNSNRFNLLKKMLIVK